MKDTKKIVKEKKPKVFERLCQSLGTKHRKREYLKAC